MNILFWHVHGAYTRAFVHGAHRYLLPTTTPRDGWGLGRPADADWPDRAIEVPVEQVIDDDVDIVVAQRPQEIDLARALLRRRPGRDVPLIYLEHNTPGGRVPFTRHPMADRDDVLVVHVTHHNRLMWDTGTTRTTVVPHGLPDPGALWSPRGPRLAMVVNEPLRRGRAVGIDLAAPFARTIGVDLFGMKVLDVPAALNLSEDQLRPYEDLGRQQLHAEMARRTAYLHLNRWTSFGLSLVEAMLLGMPVLVLASTEAAWVLPPTAGAVSANPDDLLSAAARLIRDPAMAATAGAVARDFALRRFGLQRFLDDWDDVFEQARRRRHEGVRR
jgi:hypothetical protein